MSPVPFRSKDTKADCPEPHSDWYSFHHHRHFTVAVTDISWTMYWNVSTQLKLELEDEERDVLRWNNIAISWCRCIPTKSAVMLPSTAFKVASSKHMWVPLQKIQVSKLYQSAPNLRNGGLLPGSVSRQGFQTPTSNLLPVQFPPWQSCCCLHQSALQISSVNSHFLKLH